MLAAYVHTGASGGRWQGGGRLARDCLVTRVPDSAVTDANLGQTHTSKPQRASQQKLVRDTERKSWGLSQETLPPTQPSCRQLRFLCPGDPGEIPSNLETRPDQHPNKENSGLQAPTISTLQFPDPSRYKWRKRRKHFCGEIFLSIGKNRRERKQGQLWARA